MQNFCDVFYCCMGKTWIKSTYCLICCTFYLLCFWVNCPLKVSSEYNPWICHHCIPTNPNVVEPVTGCGGQVLRTAGMGTFYHSDQNWNCMSRDRSYIVVPNLFDLWPLKTMFTCDPSSSRLDYKLGWVDNCPGDPDPEGPHSPRFTAHQLVSIIWLISTLLYQGDCCIISYFWHGEVQI